MTETPDIIIRTPEELRAEEAFPWKLSERRLDSGTAMLLFGESSSPRGDYIEFKNWRFKTEKSRLMFTAARIRDLRRDGVAYIGAPYNSIYNELSDRRLSSDSYENLNGDRVTIRRDPLVW